MPAFYGYRVYLKCIYHLWVFSYLESIYCSDIHSKKSLIWIFLRGAIIIQTGEILLPVSKWPPKGKMRPSWAVTSFTEVILQVFNRWRKIWHSLQLLFIIRKVRKHKTRYLSSNWRLKAWILENTSHFSTWTHSSFCAVILNPEVKFRLFER